MVAPRAVARYERRKRLTWHVLTRAWRPILAVARLHRATLSRHRHVLLVTGGYGKTTTTRAVRAAFGLRADGWAELNTNCLGEVGWTVLREPPWRRVGVVEAGIGTPGKMRVYAAAVRPDATIVTGVGREHLRAFASMEAVRAEKAEAVRILAPHGTAILNADDAAARWMATQTAARVHWYGFDPACAVSARDVALDWPRGTRFTLVAAGRSYDVRVRLVGRQFVYPILAAVSAGLAAGRAPEAMLPALEALAPTPARLQPVALANGAHLLCDEYKGTPETVDAALAVLATLPARRRLVVLGDLNNFPSLPAAPHYAAAGAAAARVADAVLVVGAQLEAYRVGLAAGGLPAARLWHARDVQTAIAHLRAELRDGDVALLKGYEDQGLSRIALALQGRAVGCAVTWCTLHQQACHDCPLLGVGPATPAAAPRLAEAAP